ncbi:MAG: carbamoyltransferase C-terminal domain-containing protein [bacterium]
MSAESGGPRYILGINDSHLATACLLKDGEVIGCMSEERFTRRKNEGAYPARSAAFLFDFAGIAPSDLSAVALAGHEAMDPVWFDMVTRDDDYIDEYLGIKKRSAIGRKVRKMGKKLNIAQKAQAKSLTPNEERFQTIADHLGVGKNKIHIIEHHTAHAAAAYYASPFSVDGGGNTAVLTNDASGDGLCATWNTAGPKGIERLAASPSAAGSLGSFYSLITQYLGMRQLEHEYKVMGLAPYAPDYGRERSYAVLKKMIVFEHKDVPQFRWKVRRERFRHMMENLVRHRFDWVAGAAQDLLEELLVEWARAGIAAAGEGRVALSGGVFMNVKANQRVAVLDEIEEMFVLPSCGDESNAIGAAYWYHAEGGKSGERLPCVPLGGLYLGRDIEEGSVAEAIGAAGAKESHSVRRFDDIESEVARLLSLGEVVARVKGREEFGARALGNRSILAHPRDYRVVSHINKMIKSRDFWMPFAPTILDRREEDYLLNPKGLRSPYMMITFDSTPLGAEELSAACHPYDGTLRPQILERSFNPDYYGLIEEFERLTGIGGVLNTSFNLHGEPIVSSPEDAIHTFENSGLMHLALGRYLISKKPA